MENIKIYIPNISKQAIGGGWSFLANLQKAIGPYAQLTNTWQEADIFFIAGITMVDKGELHEASKAGKKIVLRVDNVPRKSRNRRSTPHERLKEFADMADVVVYQSEWSRDYCFPLCGEGMIIRNGVDTKIFTPPKEKPVDNIYLYVYHGKNELKEFWQAHYYFQMIARQDPNSQFWFTYDFGRDLPELKDANFDFWNGEKFIYMPKITTPENMAQIMRQCKYLIYPSFADAYPNVALEARACGLELLHLNEVGGTKEILDQEDITLERMGEEYIKLFRLLKSGDFDIAGE